MKTTEYYAKVLQDGHLSVPKEVNLKPGELVRVLIFTDDEEEKLTFRKDFVTELNKAREEDAKGEGLNLEDYAKSL